MGRDIAYVQSSPYRSSHLAFMGPFPYKDAALPVYALPLKPYDCITTVLSL